MRSTRAETKTPFAAVGYARPSFAGHGATPLLESFRATRTATEEENGEREEGPAGSAFDAVSAQRRSVTSTNLVETDPTAREDDEPPGSIQFDSEGRRA
jgi:hypothetical protein